MFEKIKYKSIVLSGIIFVLCFAYNASATDINTTATVVSNIAVSEIAALDFGQFSSSASGGDVTFDAGAGISASGGVTLLGGEISGIARLDTTGAGASLVTVTMTGTTLLSGGDSMTLGANCLGTPTNFGLGADDGDCTFTSNNTTTDDVILGGVLTVGANQPAGTYTGVISVIASF